MAPVLVVSTEKSSGIGIFASIAGPVCPDLHQPAGCSVVPIRLSGKTLDFNFETVKICSVPLGEGVILPTVHFFDSIRRTYQDIPGVFDRITEKSLFLPTWVCKNRPDEITIYQRSLWVKRSGRMIFLMI